MPLQPGQTLLNKYQIERLVGEGGFGYVYQATDLLLHWRVAIKELKLRPTIFVMKSNPLQGAKSENMDY